MAGKTMFDRETRPASEKLRFDDFNDMPPLTGMKRKEKELVVGMINVWYEFVPESYDGSEEVPLVVQCHGGGQDGLRWAEKNIWHEIAQEKNLIVVFPNSPRPGAWHCDDLDIQFLCDLIQHLESVYRIDKSRIYMQGMSNGDMMTLSFTMEHPEILAGAAYTSGPTIREMLRKEHASGPLPVLQERGELDLNFMLEPGTEDVYEKRYNMNDENRAIWEEVNETAEVLPKLSIQGKNNILYYEGKKAPLIAWEIHGMGHREPASSAQMYWDYLYSGCRNVDGEHLWADPVKKIEGDEDTWILALGSNKAYHKDGMIPLTDLPQGVVRVFEPREQDKKPLDLHEMAQQDTYYAPVECLAGLFGADASFSDDGQEAEIKLQDGRIVKLWKHRCLVSVDGEYTELQHPCFLRYGVLYFPVEEFCRLILGKQVTTAHDVICISDHYALLGKYTARILCRILGGKMRPHERIPWND
ncbi:MAG: hypothetical protein IKS18_08610 [Lachnospiraceae bacterium]|nr:hypothetical protein [Lachnospiraceae bacterium]